MQARHVTCNACNRLCWPVWTRQPGCVEMNRGKIIHEKLFFFVVIIFFYFFVQGQVSSDGLVVARKDTTWFDKGLAEWISA